MRAVTATKIKAALRATTNFVVVVNAKRYQEDKRSYLNEC
jgi:hypothetical protein